MELMDMKLVYWTKTWLSKVTLWLLFDWCDFHLNEFLFNTKAGKTLKTVQLKLYFMMTFSVVHLHVYDKARFFRFSHLHTFYLLQYETNWLFTVIITIITIINGE